MRIIEALRQKNRTLLEMYIGIFFLGIVCQIVGAFLVKDQAMYARSLWFGIALAAVNLLQMYRTLDRALDFDEKTAHNSIFRGYIIRYGIIVVFMVIIMLTKVMNPLIVFMAYMSLKVTAFLQPLTHKLCNKLFHETDPVPQALPEEMQEQISNE